MPTKLGEILIRKHLITPEQLQEALDYQRKHGGRLGYNLVKLGLVSDDTITSLLSRQYGVPNVNPELFDVDQSVINLLPREVAEKYSVIPLNRIGATLTLAMVDPTNVFAMDDIKFITGLNIEPVVVSEEQLLDAINKYYRNVSGGYPVQLPGESGRTAQLASGATGHLIFADEQLTSHLLLTTISPFLYAVEEIQRVLNEARGKAHDSVSIKLISQKSPISISLAGAAEALQQIKDTVVPWRRRHAQKILNLQEQEKRAEIGSIKAEILEKRARAAKDEAEAEKTRAEANRQREETERLKIENEKLRLELQRAKVQLALDVLAQVAPNLTEADKIAYVVKLLPPLHTIIFSELEFQILDELPPDR